MAYKLKHRIGKTETSDKQREVPFTSHFNPLIYLTSLLTFRTMHPNLFPSFSLVCKPEIQSLVSFVGRCCQVFDSLVLSHRTPFRFSSLVYPDIINLGQNVNSDVENTQRKENTISSLVSRSIIGTIDVRCNNTTSWHEHVIQSCRHSP